MLNCNLDFANTLPWNFTYGNARLVCRCIESRCGGFLRIIYPINSCPQSRLNPVTNTTINTCQRLGLQKAIFAVYAMTDFPNSGSRNMSGRRWPSRQGNLLV